MKFELEALGTHWWIELPSGTKKSLKAEFLNVIEEFEDNYSRFKPESLIGRLNTNKTLPSPPAELINMLRFALDTYQATDGLFNISIGSRLEKIGYGAESDDQSEVSNNLHEDLIISEDSINLSDTTRIDLGGFGKGWLLEKLAGWLEHKGIHNFLLNGGGDITVRGKEQEILIENPEVESEYIGKVILKNSSLASSSNIKRAWEKDGKKHAHIQHPSGKELEGILSMHILAPSILFADTFATIFLLTDRETRLEYAGLYNLEFLEVHKNLQTFSTPGFEFQPN